MPRPISIKDQTIIDAARAIFLERGFAATTAEVAGRAGVSEGTLFNRFHSKVGLFQAAMALEAIDFIDGVEERVGVGDLREHLMQLAAYRLGLGVTGRCGILFVDRQEPRAKFIEADAAELDKALAMFMALLAYWQAKTGHRPS